MSSPISGFTAIPNPIMMSFMGAQSFIMMFMAGEAWQYGKRRISAMSNEEFNKISPLDLLHQQQKTLLEAIPSMEKSLEDMRPMIKTVAHEMVQAIPEIAKGLASGVTSIINPQTDGGGTTISSSGPQLLNPQAISIGQQNAEAMGIAFKQIMQALASAVGGQVGIVTDVLTEQTTSQKLTTSKEEEAKRQAQIKINALKAQEAAQAFKEKQLATEDILTKISTVHQTATQEHKPRAGQTQIQERNKLIRTLASWSNILKNLIVSANASGISTSIRGARMDSVKKQKVNVARIQTQLTGLINRYRWS